MMNNENGRSMVEMLGVLAIIGVLSVAGIAGYSMAMKKYKTNEILNAASQLVVLAQAQNGGNGGTADLDALGYADNKVAGYEMTADCTTANLVDNKCKVTVTPNSDDSFNDAKSAAGTYYVIS